MQSTLAGFFFFAFTLSSQVLFVSGLPRPAVVHQPLYLALLGGFNFYDRDQFVSELVPSLSIYCSCCSRVVGWKQIWGMAYSRNHCHKS